MDLFREIVIILATNDIVIHSNLILLKENFLVDVLSRG